MLAPLRLGVFVLALSIAIGPRAAAQTKDELAKAEKWFKEGADADKAGDYTTAIERFSQVLAVKATPQVYLRIGACQERLNRLLEAKGSYDKSLELANAAGNAKVADVVKEQIAGLVPRIPKLRVTGIKASDGATVKLDDVALAPDAIAGDILVDPGQHTVSASAPGHEPRESPFNAAIASTSAVELALRPVAVAPPSDSSAPFVTPPPETGGRSKVPGALLLAGGAAAIGVGVALFFAANGKSSTIDDECGGPDRLACPQSKQADIESRVSSVNTLRALSLVAGGVGVAGAVVGTVLLVKSGAPSAPPAARRVELDVSPSGAFVRGSF